jgi:hypothetical protein
MKKSKQSPDTISLKELIKLPAELFLVAVLGDGVADSVASNLNNFSIYLQNCSLSLFLVMV